MATNSGSFPICCFSFFQESMLRALSDSDKQEVLHLLDSIEKTFSPYWNRYPPYQLLQARMTKLREILAQKPSKEDKGHCCSIYVRHHVDLYSTFYSSF